MSIEQMATLGVVAAVWVWYAVGNYGGTVTGFFSGMFSSRDVSPEEAFKAAALLVKYYGEQGCEDGRKAAMDASRHLLDCHK